jgi:2-oxoglutarate dehydrogenase E2 component (dihydrolipoamide succinyltransferase)
MGESIVEGTITKWLKKVGETVEKDEPLFEISTDKVDAEIASPEAGVLTEIKFPEGATVGINTVVALLSENVSSRSANAPAEVPAAHAAAKPGQPAKDKTGASQVNGTPGGESVVMPQMGESIFEGTITKWLKQVGDAVEKDEPLFEISTDKVDAEIPSPVAGVLTEIKAAEGETVQINAVVAVIAAPGGASRAGASDVGKGLPATVSSEAGVPTTKSVREEVAPLASVDDGRKIKSSPLVRRIAKEHNVDLRMLRGTGSSGRINKNDILEFIRKGGAKSASVAQAAAAPVQPRPKPEAPQPKALTAEVVPLTKMRAIIAQRMVESKRISPHVHSVYKVDMTRIARLRERERAGFEQKHGVKLTYMPFIALAATEALRRFPIVNASLVDNQIHYHANINLGIAVALEWGLIVPTVREAEKRSFADLARMIADLAARARAKKLSPDEVGGSTFTLTNPGIFGDEFGIPIINQPEAAILAIGALKKEPVVLTDAEGNDTIAIRSMEYFCLGFDHRLIDGADAGRFMSEFKRQLESWDRAIG